jgi:ribose transport system substrate-binding protein
MRFAATFLAALSAAAICLAQPAKKDPPKQIRIGYSQCNRGEPWREQMDKDIKANCDQHPEIKLLARDAQNEVQRQIGHVEEFIASKVDVLIISPKDTSLTKVVAEAYKAGIPVIVLDRKVEGDDFTTFIGADNRVIGAAVGKWTKEHLHNKGNVVELQGLGTTIAAKDRSEPFHDAIKGTDVKIVYQADMEWLGDKAREKMQAALARNSAKDSIQMVYGANDPAAIQAYYAAKEAGREKEMLFVGVDALPHEGIEAVRKGILSATFEYPNGAREAVDLALKIAAEGKAPKAITLGTRLFTKDNVDKGGEEVK